MRITLPVPPRSPYLVVSRSLQSELLNVLSKEHEYRLTWQLGDQRGELIGSAMSLDSALEHVLTPLLTNLTTYELLVVRVVG